MGRFIDRDLSDAVTVKTILPGDGDTFLVRKGQSIRIIDLEGNESADTLLLNADDPDDRYSAYTTIAEQQNIYLTDGSILRTESGREMAVITSDGCGNHDTVGGCCSVQSNVVRYGDQTHHMHSCRDTFLLELSDLGGFTKKDLVPNVNFFMNVPISPEGTLTFADGISYPGCHVEMKALMDLTVVISCCAQLNNPCNAYNPTPLKVAVFDDSLTGNEPESVRTRPGDPGAGH